MISLVYPISILKDQLSAFENEVKIITNKKRITTLKYKIYQLRRCITILQFLNDETRKTKVNPYEKEMIDKLKDQFANG